MPTPIKIELTPEQIQRAEDEAQRRQRVNESKGLRGRNRAAASGSRALEMHRLGALGEVAVAAHLGLEDYLFAESEAKRGTADLPGDIEVKTRSKHKYDLIVQRSEREDKKLVLVTVENNEVLIHGWCVAGEVMQGRFWADPARGRPAYFVPKKHLNDLSSLVEVESSEEQLSI